MPCLVFGCFLDPRADPDEMECWADAEFPMGDRHAHIISMATTHPHAEATYRVVPLKDQAFGVEVAIPETYPTTVSVFATETEAEAWIANHKSEIESGKWSRKPFRKARDVHA